MYAVVKVGGKQYRVEKGGSLLVDRMSAAEGDKVTLDPLLLADGKDTVFEGSDLGKVKVEAVVTGHERGPKVHVLKFKPKRGYKRRTGHRSDLTRLEIKDIKLLQRASPAVKEAKEAEETPKAEAAQAEAKPKAPAKPRASAAKPKAETAKKPAARKPAAKKPAAKPRTTKKETEDGS
ncbi:MAG TPA: 50S ribosomal protein L21 [Thermoleophilaceae bacterium]|jgi:large subunit ribosomal protein L21